MISCDFGEGIDRCDERGQLVQKVAFGVGDDGAASGIGDVAEGGDARRGAGL